jgi:hypothetical protein
VRLGVQFRHTTQSGAPGPCSTGHRRQSLGVRLPAGAKPGLAALPDHMNIGVPAVTRTVPSQRKLRTPSACRRASGASALSARPVGFLALSVVMACPGLVVDRRFIVRLSTGLPARAAVSSTPLNWASRRAASRHPADARLA